MKFHRSLTDSLCLGGGTGFWIERHAAALLRWNKHDRQNHGIGVSVARPSMALEWTNLFKTVRFNLLKNCTIKQVRARKGAVIAITSGNCAKQLNGIADDIVVVPQVPDYVSPILTVIPLQLLAYHLAVELGRYVGKPRNLAKSVTVE